MQAEASKAACAQPRMPPLIPRRAHCHAAAGLKSCMRAKLDMSAANKSTAAGANPTFCTILTFAGLKNCMRIKLDMSAANKALRDPVAFRCNLTHHWRTGHTYKVSGDRERMGCAGKARHVYLVQPHARGMRAR